jgi:hypothetical protein
MMELIYVNIKYSQCNICDYIWLISESHWYRIESWYSR